MMSFSPPRPKRQRATENIVPMINVVFLLLIFFLMSAQIAPPDPVEITPPEGAGTDDQRGRDILYVMRDGTVFFGGQTGDPALALIAERSGGTPLFIRADADLPAAVLAALLPKLAAAGVGDTRLVIRGR